MSDRITLNQIRLVCNEADRGSLKILSTFDKSETMEHKTDESIAFPDDHIVVIKNRRECACVVRLESIRLESGKRFVLATSRQMTRTLKSKLDSEVDTSCAIALGGGEALTIRTSAWRAPTGMGANVGPV
jgi:hypothetical protein